MVAWQDILNDPDYQGLPDTEKRKVADSFFSKTISADPDYSALPSEEQQKVRFGFYAKNGFNPQDNAKESFLQKLKNATIADAKLVGGAAGLAMQPLEVLSAPLHGAADWISRKATAAQDKLGNIGAGNPTLEAFTTAGQGVLQGIKGAAQAGAALGSLSPMDIGFMGAGKVVSLSKQAASLAPRIKLLASAPADIKAAELAKMELEHGKQVVNEAMSLADLQATTGTTEKAKAATLFVPPYGWKSTTPIGNAPVPTPAGKPFTLQAGLGADNQAALEAFRAKLPKGPEIPPPLPQAAPQAVKAAPMPVVTTAPVEAAGKGFAGNINLTKYPKPVAELFTRINNATGVAERVPQSIVEMKAVGATPEFRGMTEKLASLPEGGVAGEFANYREAINIESKTVLNALKPSLESGAEDIDNLLAINKKLENVSKVSNISGKLLKVHQKAADSELAQQLFDIAEKRKQEAIALNSPLTSALVDGLTDFQKKVLGKKIDLMQTSRLYRETLKKSDQAYQIYLNAILSNPYTHLRNTAGNVVFAGMKPIEKLTSASIEKVRSLLPGGVAPTNTFSEVGGQIKGAAKFFGNALDPRNMGEGWLGNLQKGLPFDVRQAGQRLDSEMASPIAGKMGEIINIPLTLLKIEDDIAKALIGQMEYAGLKSRGLSGEALKAGVMKEVAYRTFQEKSGPIVNALITVRDSVPGAKLVIPFIKTPIQLVERGAERSPLGFLKIIGQQYKYGKNYSRADFATDLGNTLLGSSAAAFLAWQYGKDKISGAYPTDKTEREMWQAQGKTEWSYKYKGRWLPLAKIEPIGSVVKIAIAGMDAWKNEKQEMPIDRAARLAYRLGSDLGVQSSLNGFNTFANALSDPEKNLNKIVSGVATGFIPGISKFATYLTDSTLRAKKGIVETAKSKIPGLSQTLPPQRDILGNPLQKDLFWGSKNVPTPELDFANSLGVTLPDTKKIFQPLAPISTQEQDSYRFFVGVRIKGLLQQEMQKPTYSNPYEEKKFLETQMRDYAETGRAVTIVNSELRDLGINLSATPQQAAYLYENVLRHKRYKPLSKDQRRAVINRIILGGK